MKKNWIILTLSIMLILTSCKTPLKVYAVNDKVNNCKYILEFVSVEQTKFSFNFTVLNKNMNNDSFYDRVVVDFSRTDGVIFHYTIFIDGIETDVRDKNKDTIRIEIVFSEEEMNQLVNNGRKNIETFLVWNWHFIPIKSDK